MPTGKQKSIYNTGLYITPKRRKKGVKWYVYAWRRGPLLLTAEGVRPIVTRDILDAQAACLKLEAERKALVKTAETPKLNDLIRDYEKSPEFTSKQPSTLRDYRLWLTRISEKFGPVELSAFETRKMRGDILAWRDTWAAQPRTADKAVVMMNTLLNWGVEHGQLALNVLAGAKLLHKVNKADEIWEERHWNAFRAVDEETGKPVCPPHLMDALVLASLTGLRLGDLVRLSWENIGKNSISVITRKKRSRAVIPIYPDLRRHLEAREHRTGTILRNSRGEPWTESGLGSVFQKTKPEGFDRTIHDLRGSFATWLAQEGFTDQEIARTIGWTAQRVGEIRARYVDEARVVVSLAERLAQSKTKTVDT